MKNVWKLSLTSIAALLSLTAESLVEISDPDKTHSFFGSDNLSFIDNNGIIDDMNIINMRWGDFNGDGLDDVAVLVAPLKNELKIKNIAKDQSANDQCLTVGEDFRGGSNPFWRSLTLAPCYSNAIQQIFTYDVHSGEIRPKALPDRCVRISPYGSYAHLYKSCDGTDSSFKFDFYADGTLRSRGTHDTANAVTSFDYGEVATFSPVARGENDDEWLRTYQDVSIRVFLNTTRNDNAITLKEVQNIQGINRLPFWGDFNGDGKKELLLNKDPEKVTDYANEAPTYVVFDKAIALGVADFNADSIDDILYIAKEEDDKAGLALHQSLSEEASYIINNGDRLDISHAETFLNLSPYLGEEGSALGGAQLDNIKFLSIMTLVQNANPLIIIQQGLKDGVVGGNIIHLSTGVDGDSYDVKSPFFFPVGKQLFSHVGKLDGRSAVFSARGNQISAYTVGTLGADDIITYNMTYQDTRLANETALEDKLSIADLNGDGNSDIFIKDSVTGSSIALIHTKLADISADEGPNETFGMFANVLRGGKAFTRGTLGAHSYIIGYDHSGTLRYKIKKADTFEWSKPVKVPDTDYNHNALYAENGIKSIVVGNYIYTFRFDNSDIYAPKVYIDRWFIDKYDRLMRASTYTEENHGTLDSTIVVELYEYDDSYALMEKTHGVDSDDGYIHTPPGNYSVNVVSPSTQEAQKIHVTYAKNTEVVADLSFTLNKDGSIPEDYNNMLKVDENRQITFIKGSEFVEAVTATERAVSESGKSTIPSVINLVVIARNAQGNSGISAFIVPFNAEGGLLDDASPIVKKNEDNQFICDASAYLDEQFIGRHTACRRNETINYNASVDGYKRYLGVVPDSTNIWGFNIVAQSVRKDSIVFFKPGDNSETQIPHYQLGYHGSGSLITAMSSNMSLSTSRMCSQLTLLINNDQLTSFDLNCIPVKLVPLETEFESSVLKGIIEGPPPFPVENLIQKPSKPNYPELIFTQDNTSELSLATSSSSGTQRALDLSVLFGIGIGPATSFNRVKTAIKSYNTGRKTKDTYKQISIPTFIEGSAECQPPIINTDHANKYRAYSEMYKNIMGYNLRCAYNRGTLVTQVRRIKVFGITDLSEETLFGFVTVPVESAFDDQDVTNVRYIPFPIDPHYSVVGSLDGYIGRFQYDAKSRSYEGLSHGLRDSAEQARYALYAQKKLIEKKFEEHKALVDDAGVFSRDGQNDGITDGVTLNGLQLRSAKNINLIAGTIGGSTQSITASVTDSSGFTSKGDSSGGIRVKNEKFFVKVEGKLTFGVNWDMRTNLSQSYATERKFEMVMPYSTFAQDINYETVEAQCLGLVVSWVSIAQYIPESKDNYTHFINRVWDESVAEEAWNNIPGGESNGGVGTFYGEKAKYGNSRPWRITYAAEQVERTYEAAESECSAFR